MRALSKILQAAVAFCVFWIPAFAQNTTTVSGTVKDSNGVPYSNATVQAQLLPTGITPTIPPPCNGQNATPCVVSAFQRGSTDANGNFNMNLASNAVLSPGGTTWQFTVNTTGAPPPLGTGPQSCSATLTISGASQSVSASFASCPVLSITANSTASLSAVIIPPGTDSGVANAYVVNPTPAVTLTLGKVFTWTTTNANTAASTMNASGTGVQALTDYAGQALTGGEIGAGITYASVWNGNEWLTNVTAGVGTANERNVNTLNAFNPLVISPKVPTVGVGDPNLPLVMMVTPFLANSSNYPRMLSFACHGSGGCSGGPVENVGFFGNGEFVIGSTTSTLLAFLNSVETFGLWQFNNNSGLANDQNITINPTSTKTSGNMLVYKNGAGPVIFAIDNATGKLNANVCASSATPAVCGASWTGAVAIPAAATTLTVNTTAAATNSDIFISRADWLGAILGVTCNTQSSLTLGTPRATTLTAGTSFVVSLDAAPTTNPMCLVFHIEN